MKFSLIWKLGLVLGLMIAIGAIAYPFVRGYLKTRGAPKFRTAKVVTGEIFSVDNATGTVQPTLRVQVGAVVSGPIVELNVDHNDHVRKVDSKEELSEEELAERRQAFQPVRRELTGWLARYQKLVSNASQGGVLEG